jgi:hypothetical protein
VQRFAHPDRQPQPGYLLLSNNQGGFPRFGMLLDGRSMPDTAYVDLHRNGNLTNRFGAMNQIYPHELLHLMVSDLLGPMPDGRDNQVHALGVRTDRVTAFSEGFAEHAQPMAVEAQGVSPVTSRLPSDPELLAAAGEQFAAYRDAVAARWSIAPSADVRRVVQPAQGVPHHAVKGTSSSANTELPDPERTSIGHLPSMMGPPRRAGAPRG